MGLQHTSLGGECKHSAPSKPGLTRRPIPRLSVLQPRRKPCFSAISRRTTAEERVWWPVPPVSVSPGLSSPPLICRSCLTRQHLPSLPPLGFLRQVPAHLLVKGDCGYRLEQSFKGLKRKFSLVLWGQNPVLQFPNCCPGQVPESLSLQILI